MDKNRIVKEKRLKLDGWILKSDNCSESNTKSISTKTNSSRKTNRKKRSDGGKGHNYPSSRKTRSDAGKKRSKNSTNKTTSRKLDVKKVIDCWSK